MKLSTETYSLLKHFDERSALDLIAAASFDCVDYSFYWLTEPNKTNILGEGYREHARDIRAHLDGIGLRCNQAHAPFEFNAQTDVCDESNAHFLDLLRSMEAAAILGASSIVIHSVKPLPGDTALEANLRFYGSLEPYARRFGIHIAVENLFGGPYDAESKRWLGSRFDRPDTMLELLRRLNSDVFVCCVDVGHATVTGIAPQDYIRGLSGDILRALHIQDNHLLTDDHLLPFTGKIDWDEVTRALADIHYDGELTLEIFRFLDAFPAALTPEALRLAAAVGRHLIAQIEAR